MTVTIDDPRASRHRGGDLGPADTAELPVLGAMPRDRHDAMVGKRGTAGAGSPMLPQLATSVWTPRTVVVAAILGAGSLLGVLICWYGVSGRATFGTQQPWLVGGVFSLLVGGVGGAALVGSGMRRVRLASRVHLVWVRVLFELPPLTSGLDLAVAAERDAGIADPSSVRSATSPAAANGRDEGSAWVTNDVMTRRHRPGCLLVSGKDVRAATTREVARLRPCGVCDA